MGGRGLGSLRRLTRDHPDVGSGYGLTPSGDACPGAPAAPYPCTTTPSGSTPHLVRAISTAASTTISQRRCHYPDLDADNTLITVMEVAGNAVIEPAWA